MIVAVSYGVEEALSATGPSPIVASLGRIKRKLKRKPAPRSESLIMSILQSDSRMMTTSISG